ncbi:WD repeat-containing on Y chromosome-like isoform X2 [Labeo rohita]|uniref:WD repeat-containing on Y chromosome-like isoform X2 n=2 Tax=Labeonini TaxID=2743697 RepID=A0A498MYS7_LABRO|nr:WD repeat-containing on Y chromosome-like isoform X2 [Labeo rohita]
MPQFFNDAVETHPLLTPERQPVIDVDEVKGGRMKKKCKKIKRFWKALFGHSKASQKYTQMTSSADDEDTDAAALQSRRNTENQISSVQGQAVACAESDLNDDASAAPVQQGACDEDGANREEKEEKCKKKKSVWKVLFGHKRPSQKALQTPACHVADQTVDALQDPASTVSHKCDEASQDPVHPESDLNGDTFEVPVRAESDWSDDAFLTPNCSMSDWSVNDAFRTPVGSLFEWAVDAFQMPVHPESDLNGDAFKAPAHPESVWSAEAFQAPGHTKSLFDPCPDIFSYYEVGNKLGQGGFGAVYEGRRVKDGLEVAVKFVKKSEDTRYINFPEPLPLEVALLIMANAGSRVPQIIQLLDWMDVGKYYIMVLERLIPCEDVFDFVQRDGGRIDEKTARVIVRQATQAALVSCQRGVLHRDIKLENLLINKNTLEVKLIDFGCGDLLRSTAYTTFMGTPVYSPPEFVAEGKYHGEPATVYSLGVLLFSLVCGGFPDKHDLLMIDLNRWFIAGLSQDMNTLKRHEDPWKIYKEETPSTTQHFAGRSVCLLESLQSSHLRSLMESFFRQRSVRSKASGRVRARDRVSANSMSFEDFFSSLKEATGQDYRRSDVEELFNEASGKDSRVELHQEAIVRVLALSQSPPMRYISVSKRGTLIVWNRHLNNIKPLELCAGPFNKRQHRKRFQGWTTDAVYMANVHKIAVATLSRGIHFFDVTTTCSFEQVHLFGLSHIPTALCYWYDTEAPGEKCVLMWGDDRGSVNLLWFLQPFKGLFEMPFTNQTGPVQIFMPDIHAHSALVSYQNIPNIHSEPINRILYEPHDELIITSSESPASSVVIIDVNQKREEYIWKTEKGVKCFDFSFSLGLLVTAGVGPAVRLWNRYVTSRPTAVLHSHQTAVVDVVIHQALGKIFSYSKDAVLKIWDIPSQQCVKTIPLHFPNIQLSFTPEHGSFPLLLSLTPDPVLLVTCREYLAALHLHKSESSSRSGIYTCALYNLHLQQVITACADSTLTVWDVKTGIKRMEIRNAHGKEEVSCMALDVHQRRLISAATNGTIKASRFGAEVTGIICHHDNQLLTTGWSRLIAQYSIAFSDDIYVKADLSWKSGCQHGEDILAMDHCPGLGLLATGSFDGEIIIWSLALQKPITRLQTNQQDTAHLPVHRLLFLQRRAQQSHLRSDAVLLSSQAGFVCWWSVCGPRHNQGQFYVPDGSNENVMGLSTDQENTLLVTGDTCGSIRVWDISQYALNGVDMESAEDLPPLLHSWRGHERAIVSIEVLVYESQLFVLSASVDHRACLWTAQGVCVGCFGQEQQWDLSNPDTYQTNRYNELALDLQRLQTALETPDSECMSDRSSSLEKFPLPKYSKVLSGDHAFGDLEIKMTARQRRPRDIGREKLCRFGNEFTPLQALELPEISELKDVPLKPWKLKIRQISSRGTEVSSRTLSSEDSLRCETLDD